MDDERPLSYASDRNTSAFRGQATQNTNKPISVKGSIIASELKGSVLDKASQKSADRSKSKSGKGKAIQSP